MRRTWMLAVAVLYAMTAGSGDIMAQQSVIFLTWEDVIGLSLSNNLDIKQTEHDYENQILTSWEAYTDFLPTVSYQGSVTNNLELPVITIMDTQMKMGTEYNYSHTLQLSYTILTGGQRLANIHMQTSLKKSLKEELMGMQDATVLSALTAYYNIMLTDALVDVTEEAIEAARTNLEQVQRHHESGAASNLDLMRAQAQHSATLPQYQSALNNKRIAISQMKNILDVSLSDSIVVVDTLAEKDFMGDRLHHTLDELKEVAIENRSELKMVKHQIDAMKQQEKIVAAQFIPTVSLTADVSQTAMRDNSIISSKDHTRSKSISLMVNLPLFEGGRRALEYQQAKVESRKIAVVEHQTEEQILLSVEQAYFALQVAIENLSALELGLEQARESLRLANLLYREEMNTQVDVLDAQLVYTQSYTDYQQGIYDYNVNQLVLMREIGEIKSLLE